MNSEDKEFMLSLIVQLEGIAYSAGLIDLACYLRMAIASVTIDSEKTTK